MTSPTLDACIGATVQRHRLAFGRSLGALAMLTGLDADWLADAESGMMRFKARDLLLLADGLEVPVGDLLIDPSTPPRLDVRVGAFERS